jgi:plastocyanin
MRSPAEAKRGNMSQQSSKSKQMTRREVLERLGVGIFAAAALASCTKENDHYVVRIDSQNFYDPSTLIIPVGTTVTWQNVGLYPNTVTCDPTKVQDTTHVLLPKAAQSWDSGLLYPGQMWTYRFDTPGDYIYFSRTKESASMLGTLTVTA